MISRITSFVKRLVGATPNQVFLQFGDEHTVAEGSEEVLILPSLTLFRDLANQGPIVVHTPQTHQTTVVLGNGRKAVLSHATVTQFTPSIMSQEDGGMVLGWDFCERAV